MYNAREYKPTRISTATGTQVFTGKGILHAIVVGSTTATALGVFDSIGSTAGTVVLLKSSIAENTYTLDATIANGLYVISGAGDYTILWTK